MNNLAQFDLMLKTLVVSTPVEALGWNTAIHDLDVAAGPQMFLYVHDAPSKWTWMAAVSREEFFKISKMGGAMKPELMNEVRGGLLHSVFELADMKVGQTNPDQENDLGLALSLYAGSTKTFQAAGGFKDGGHFCVILYRQPNQTQHVNIRPFALPGSFTKPIDSDSFLVTVQQVEKMDSVNHPEWFI